MIDGTQGGYELQTGIACEKRRGEIGYRKPANSRGSD
jgi:hypothetical protein